MCVWCCCVCVEKDEIQCASSHAKTLCYVTIVTIRFWTDRHCIQVYTYYIMLYIYAQHIQQTIQLKLRLTNEKGEYKKITYIFWPYRIGFKLRCIAIVWRNDQKAINFVIWWWSFCCYIVIDPYRKKSSNCESTDDYQPEVIKFFWIVKNWESTKIRPNIDSNYDW